MEPADLLRHASNVCDNLHLAYLVTGSTAFASPEDVIIKKMVYFQEGGSEKHLRDIAGVLRIQAGAVDRAYIESWAGKLGLSDVWRQVQEREQSP